MVTGASDGIGKEFAFQLAKAGFNVLLVARNKGLLDSTASEISMFLAVCLDTGVTLWIPQKISFLVYLLQPMPSI